MRFRFLSLGILSITLLIVSAAAYAQEVSKEESERLQGFFKNRFGVNIPSDSKIEVEGFEKSTVGDLKSGKFVIQSAGGAQEVPFVISADGKYVLMGNLVDTKSFEATPIKGIKKGAVPIPRGEFPLLITDDGKYLIINSEIVDTGTFKPSELKGLKGGSFVMGGSQQVPVYVSDNGQYIVLGTEIMDTTVDPHQEIMEKISLVDVPFKGKKDAEVIVVEYSDFQCPFCKRGKDMLPDILKQYEGKINVSFKQLPLRNHNWAMPAAIASACAYKQGNEKFWEMHDRLFDNQKDITLENSEQKFNQYAKEIGLDTKKFDACLDSKDVKAQVEKDVEEATSIGVQSTPTFVVNGMIVPGANPEGLKSAIDIKLSQGS